MIVITQTLLLVMFLFLSAFFVSINVAKGGKSSKAVFNGILLSALIIAVVFFLTNAQ